MAGATLQTGGGLMESVGGAVSVAASLLLVLMVAALAAYAYKSLRGGVEWPEDRDPEESEDEIRQGSEDDEWDYY
jgi:hypothetical protein